MRGASVTLRAVLTLALAACVSPSAGPSPSPTASVAASVSATPTPSPTPRPTTDPATYGYIAPSSERFWVLPERAADPVLDIGGERAAASHDGKRIAFWRTGPQGGNPQDLRIVEVPGGAERMLMSLSPGLTGGVIVWSNDDTGLLFAVHSVAQFPGVGGGPRSSGLQSYDLSASAGAIDGALLLTDGRVYVPLAWDKPGQMASALTTGEGGMAIDYWTWDRRNLPTGQAAVKSTRFPWQAIAERVRVSSDSKRLSAIDLTANVLRVWPIADITASDMVSPGTGKVGDASWRPRTPADLAWVVDQNVSLFTYQTSSVRVVHRGQGFVQIASWRADGSGIVLFEQGRGPFILDLSSLQVTPLTAFGGTVGDGVLLK
jgi:hypothetical protein